MSRPRKRDKSARSIFNCTAEIQKAVLDEYPAGFYSDDDMSRIREKLPLRDEAEWSKAWSEINVCAGDYLEAKRAMQARMKPSEAKDIARRAARAMQSALDNLHVVDIERRELGVADSGSACAADLNFVSRFLANLRDQYQAVASISRTKPRSAAPREIFVGILLLHIWPRYTGRPSSGVPGRRGDRKNGSPKEFVRACLNPLGDATGIADIIQTVLYPPRPK